MSKLNILLVMALSVGCSLVTAIVISAGSVFADGTGAGPVATLVPYEGVIERDGTPLDGTVTLRFSLWDGPGANASSWTEDQEVTASRGRFAVSLGATSAPKAAELAALMRLRRDLYLKIGVVDGGSEIPLAGQQRLLPAPFALAAGDGFTAGQTTLGATRSGPLTVAGDLEVTGSRVRFGTEQGTADPQRAALGVDGTDGSLVVNPGSGFAGGTRVEGALNAPTLASTTIATGSLAASGAVSAGSLTTGQIQGVPGADGRPALSLGDRVVVTTRLELGTASAVKSTINPGNNGKWGGYGAWAYCPPSTYVCGFRQQVEGDMGGGDDTALNGVELACCHFGAAP